MEILLTVVLTSTVLMACSRIPRKSDQSTQAGVLDPDRWMDSAPIEDCILTLPAFLFHEESVEQFATRIHAARSLPENMGKGPDFLYCGGDGTWGPKEFTLDRPSRTLTVRALPTDLPPPEGDGSVRVMKQVSGEWVETPPDRVTGQPALPQTAGNGQEAGETSAPHRENRPVSYPSSPPPRLHPV